MVFFRKGIRKLTRHDRNVLNNLIRGGHDLLTKAKSREINSDVFLKKSESFIRRARAKLRDVDPAIDITKLNEIITRMEQLEELEERIAHVTKALRNEMPGIVESFK